MDKSKYLQFKDRFGLEKLIQSGLKFEIKFETLLNLASSSDENKINFFSYDECKIL